MNKEYVLKVAGLTRRLPICPINDKLDIAAFIMFSDIELTIACACIRTKRHITPPPESKEGGSEKWDGYSPS